VHRSVQASIRKLQETLSFLIRYSIISSSSSSVLLEFTYKAVDLLNSCWGPLTRITVIQLHRRSQNIRAPCVIKICDLSARMVQTVLALHCVQDIAFWSFVKLLIVPGASAWTVEGIYYFTCSYSRGTALLSAAYEVLSNIFLTKLSPQVREITGFITVHFDITLQLTAYYAFIRY